MRLTVDAMGSAAGDFPSAAKEKAYALGQAIGRRGFVLISGACPGLPYEYVRGAQNEGGLSVGISPALSLDEHVHKYLSPSDVFDVLIYTGSGLMGREVTTWRRDFRNPTTSGHPASATNLLEAEALDTPNPLPVISDIGICLAGLRRGHRRSMVSVIGPSTRTLVRWHQQPLKF